MSQYILNFFRLIKEEFKTDLGRFNLYTSSLLCTIFGGFHFINFIKQLINIIFGKDIVTGNGDKFFYSMLLYFIISLTLLAFKRKN